MKTNGGTAAPAKVFEIWQSEKSYRYKQEAIYNHAPQVPGIYELVTFDEQQNAQVLFAELTRDKSIAQALQERLEGMVKPSVEELLGKYPNLYFSFVVDSNAKSPEDQQDLFWAICQQDKPALMDLSQIRPTGRYGDITVRDKSIL